MTEQELKNLLVFIDVAVNRGAVRGEELEAVATIRRSVISALEAVSTEEIPAVENK